MAYAPTHDTELPAVRLPAAPVPGQAALLTPGALAFLTELHRRFEPARQARLIARRIRAARFDEGELPDFRADTAQIREGDWRVAPLPAALLDRRVEITGPVDWMAPDGGKHYVLKPERETVLMVRPRGWHLDEKHLLVDGQRMSASL